MRQYLSPISRVAFLTAAFVCFNPGRAVAAEVPPPANEPAPAPLAFTVTAPAGKTAQQVHDVVVAAATARGWTIQDNTTDKVVVFHRRHSHEATVTLVISSNGVTAYCEGYAVTSKGVRKHPEQPKDWLNYLRQDITKMLSGRPAR